MTLTSITSWKALAEALGIAQNTLRSWRADLTSPLSKDIAEWRLWRDNRLPTQGRDTKFEAASIADLKKALLLEQGRKERAIASLRELELNARERETLCHRSEASRNRSSKTLTPLQPLTGCAPSLGSSLCKPTESNDRRAGDPKWAG